MTVQSQKNAGIALLIFVSLMFFTMVLHPVGGNIEHLMRVRVMIIVVHSVALFSLPFAGMGFWGLTRKIGIDQFYSMMGFAMILLGLVAVLLAASTNGLILPLFIERYKDASKEQLDAIAPIFRYNFMVNHAFDYVYTFAFSIAMMCWSWAIIKTRKLPRWLATTGIVLGILSIIVFLLSLTPASIVGFRIFVTTIIAWIAAVAVVLFRAR